MPRLIIGDHTAELIRLQALTGYSFRESARRLDNGLLEVEVNREILAAVNEARLPGGSDDDVVGRLVRTAIDRRPN